MSCNTEQLDQDELEAPAWLDADFLAGVLRASENDDSIRVTALQLSPAAQKGDHFGSVMFRASVEYESARAIARANGADALSQPQPQRRSLIVKTVPESEGARKEMLQQSLLFETEVAMYAEVIPRFEAELQQLGEETSLAARCLHHSLSPRKVIVLEDLVPLGYALLRERHPDLQEAKLAYSKLAKWHAVSFKLHRERPAWLAKFQQHFLDLDNPELVDFFKSCLALFADTLATRPTLREYAPYFEALRPTLVERCRALLSEYRLQPRRDAFYVLCHGDLHRKNLMFRRCAAGRPQDVRLLDFQLCHVGPASSDLVYSAYTLLGRSLRWQQLDELRHHYFRCFVDTLQRLHYAGRQPRLLELRQLLLRHKDLDLLLLASHLPTWNVFSEADVDPERLVCCPEYRRQLYTNPSFTAELEEALPSFLHRGYLES